MTQTPKVSVIMTTFNGADLIAHSLDSILAQTFRDFELIVVDDYSTDGTAERLSAYGDPRLRVFRNAANLGVVGARNRAFALARGELVAANDHDDLSAPSRLARQVEYLEANPEVVLLGTKGWTLEGKSTRVNDSLPHKSPRFIDWMLHIGNPMIYSSIMFRRQAVEGLGEFLREDVKYADDYDLYVRLSRIGAIACLDEFLSTYRLHAQNTTKTREDEMIVSASKILKPLVERHLGPDSADAARLIATHVAARRTIPDLETFDALARSLGRLVTAYVAAHPEDVDDLEAIKRHSGRLWYQICVQAGRRGLGRLSGLTRRHRFLASLYSPTAAERLKQAVASIPGAYRAVDGIRGIARREKSVLHQGDG